MAVVQSSEQSEPSRTSIKGTILVVRRFVMREGAVFGSFSKKNIYISIFIIYLNMADKGYAEKIEKMRENFKDIIVASFYKETQVNRSIHSSKRDGIVIDVDKYKRLLLYSIRRLRKLVDNFTIKNSDIRDEIKKLSEETGVSIGQSQKVINVYLKFYCLLKDCKVEIIKELDCPLDSTTMEKKQKMKNVLNMNDYINWQNKFEKEFGIRLLRDNEYDLNRISVSFK